MYLKNKVVLILTLLSGAIYSQVLDVNTKKGFAANGYDVVSYFDTQPQEGSKEITYTLDGVNYKFSSISNKEKFISDPLKYVPQYGGYCAYAMAVSAKKVSIDPMTYEIRDSKLYLFYNSGKNNTLVSWLNESPDMLKNQADENWEKVKVLRR